MRLLFVLFVCLFALGCKAKKPEKAECPACPTCASATVADPDMQLQLPAPSGSSASPVLTDKPPEGVAEPLPLPGGVGEWARITNLEFESFFGEWITTLNGFVADSHGTVVKIEATKEGARTPWRMAIAHPTNADAFRGCGVDWGVRKAKLLAFCRSKKDDEHSTQMDLVVESRVMNGATHLRVTLDGDSSGVLVRK